jgi:hypothetical protein
MTQIRPLERRDLPAVATLLAARLPGWSQDRSFLADSLIDQRWAEPELPSLVAVDDGDEILGFIGAQVRRMRFDERLMTGVCCSHLAVVGDRRAGATGALLLRRLLSGRQDLTWTATATDTVTRIWDAFGGGVDHARTLDWMLVLRPGRWARRLLATRLRGGGSVRVLAPARALPLQAAGRRFAPNAFPAVPADVRGEDATALAVLESLPELTRDARLRVDYDQPYLDQLLEQVDATAGPLVNRLVRRGENAIGWYAYVCREGGASRVLHICSRDAEIDAVVSELVDHAREGGSPVLTGRLEPHLRTPLANRAAVMGVARTPLIHCGDPDVRAALGSGSSLITDLDGEWFAT